MKALHRTADKVYDWAGYTRSRGAFKWADIICSLLLLMQCQLVNQTKSVTQSSCLGEASE